MDFDNPLQILGVPQEVILKAYTEKTPKIALAIAENAYKSLAKVFHPDLPTGDVDYMAKVSSSIEELRDPDALVYYIEELVSAQDAHDFKSKKPSPRMAPQSNQLEILWKAPIFINQFRQLGLTEPSSFVWVDKESKKSESGTGDIINMLEIRSPEEEAYLYSFDNVGEKFAYYSGKWHRLDRKSKIQKNEDGSTKDFREDTNPRFRRIKLSPQKGHEGDDRYATFIDRENVIAVGFVYADVIEKFFSDARSKASDQVDHAKGQAESVNYNWVSAESFIYFKFMQAGLPLNIKENEGRFRLILMKLNRSTHHKFIDGKTIKTQSVEAKFAMTGVIEGVRSMNLNPKKRPEPKSR